MVDFENIIYSIPYFFATFSITDEVNGKSIFKISFVSLSLIIPEEKTFWTISSNEYSFEKL